MILLVYLVTLCDWWFSVGCLFFFCALCTHVILLAVTGCVSAFPRAPTRAYFVRYLAVTVKIRTLESIFPVLLAGSIVCLLSVRTCDSISGNKLCVRPPR